MMAREEPNIQHNTRNIIDKEISNSLSIYNLKGDNLSAALFTLFVNKLYLHLTMFLLMT